MSISGFLDKNPFVRIILPFALGIVFHCYWSVPAMMSISALGIFAALAVFLFRPNGYKSRWACGAALFLSIAALGSAMAALNTPPNVVSNAGSRKCEYRASVTGTPSVGEKACKVDMRVEALNLLGEWHDFDARIVATIMKDSAAAALKAGQTIKFSSRIDTLDMPKNPFGFNYSQYLQLNGVQGSIFLNPGEWELADGSVHGLRQHALNMRQMLVGLLEKAGLEGNELGLASTLVLGYKNNIDAEVKQAYMNAGAMHVLAVSGMHVGIVCSVLEMLMFVFGGRLASNFKRLVIVLLLWVYAFITGLSPSVLRATVMFSFLELGRLMRRDMSIYNTLAASAFLLLVINPDMLFKAGFQLSYAAVIGIVSLQPRIVRLLPVNRRNKPLRWFWELTAVSIAAQISTFPFCLYYFERTPVYFWLSNVVVSPGAVLMIGLTMLLLAVSPVPVLTKVIGVATTYAARAMNWAVMSISNFPFSTIENTYISVFQAVAIGVTILAALIWLRTRNCNWLMASLASFLVFITPFSASSVRNSSTQALCVYYSPRNALAQFVDGNSSYWVQGAIGDARQAALMVKGGNIFWNSSHSADVDMRESESGRMLVRDGFFVYDSVSGLMISDSTPRFKMKQPATLDFLIISGKPAIKPRQMPKNLTFSNVIIDGSVPPWLARDWERRYANSNVHNVRQKGAFICQLASAQNK
ncbi:MAG: ComEC family competence protein [Salinivirgaceae bacterium]|nr:ComEC family competence protein [Salinivirgaceae bacterium]